MKKFLILLLVMVVLALGAMPILAVPPTDLNELASYFPADTPIFVSTRTDDEFVETLDSVLARIGAAIPDAMPPMTISEGLDGVVSQLYDDGTFAENIRPWLGDTASFAVTSLAINMDEVADASEAPVIFALSIKDQAGASAFLDDMLTKSDVEFTRVEEDDYLLLLDADDSDQEMVMQSAILLRDGVLMATNDASSLPTDALPENALSDNAEFTAALDSLPEDSYNATVYVAFTEILQSVMENEPEAADAMGVFGSIFDAIGPQAWGFTILDDVSLTVDIVQQIGDLSALGDAGLVMGTPKPINLDFAVHVPADASLAVFASDLNTSIGGVLDNLVKTTEMIAEMPNATGSDMSPEELQQGIAQIEQAFTAFTGLNFRDDVLDWMSGDYALFLMLNPALDTGSMMGLMSEFPVDFGLAIEATDPVAAQNMVEGLTRGLNQTLAMAGLSDQATEEADDSTEEPGNSQPKVDITTEDLAGTDVTVITITAPDLPWPIELLMGANDEVFALGTRTAVTAIFNPDGGLPSNPEFARAQALMLDNPASLAWLGTEGLLPLADLGAAFGQRGDSGDDMTEQIRSVISLFSSGTITSTSDGNGTAARLVLTLSE